MSDKPAPEKVAEKTAEVPTASMHSMADVLASLKGKIVTMVNPESLEDAPMGYQLTTGFYRAKILTVSDQMVIVGTELVRKGREAAKEPVKQFIPIHRIKRISIAKSDILVHI